MTTPKPISDEVLREWAVDGRVVRTDPASVGELAVLCGSLARGLVECREALRQIVAMAVARSGTARGVDTWYIQSSDMERARALLPESAEGGK